MRKAWCAVAAVLALSASAPAAQAGSPLGAVDTREAGPAVRDGKLLPVEVRAQTLAPVVQRAASALAEPGAKPALGTVKIWLSLDNTRSVLYYKPYTLRALGDNIEVWVANDLSFPAGDCRNDSVTVTDAQAQYLADQFDTVMYPRESAAFSVPPARDGSEPTLNRIPGPDGRPIPAPAGYWGGEGDDIVTLVDNVIDPNYFDTNWQANTTYVAGAFVGASNELLDRNVMTVDAFDWLHRIGADPPDAPSADQCLSRPARPFLYEGTFAHEYQHLLEYYEDADEDSWVNEGLSDWAMVLTGYADPRPPITDRRFSSHIQSFLGYYGIRTPVNPNPRDAGPENGLTLWGDQGPTEILADYGAAHTLMEMLGGRYGSRFLSALHRQDANGFDGLTATLAAAGQRDTPRQIVRDWLATAALDGVLGRGASIDGRARWRLETDSLDATVNWSTVDAYGTPGAPPSGADFVRLRGATGAFLRADELRSLVFEGAEHFVPAPPEWVVDPAPEERPGDPALFSGEEDLVDRSLVRAIDVPAGAPTLTFESRWFIEPGFDFGYVQVSADEGRTWTSLANDDTTDEHDPATVPAVIENLPGLTGNSVEWRTETFDLSAYAGRTVLLRFRYITDRSVALPGWWIDDVAIGGSLISAGDRLAGWRSLEQVMPTPVPGYLVQLVGYTSKTLGTPAERRGGPNVAFAHRLALAGGRVTALGRPALRRLLGPRGRRADVVAVLVTQLDPTATSDEYARYALKVNGVTQPGG
jgi:Immune inhibitor A peptidase M6